MYREREKEKPEASVHANDANKLIAWLIKTRKSSAFSLYFTNSTVQKLLKKMFECVSKYNPAIHVSLPAAARA